MDDATTRQVKAFLEAGDVRGARRVATLGQLRGFRGRWIAGFVTLGTIGGSIVKAKLGL